MKRGRNLAGSMLVNATGTGKVMAGNRGLGNQGLRLEAGRPYEGYFFVRAPNGTTSEQLASAGVQAVVTLDDYTSSPPAILASQLLPIPSPALRGEWVMVNFSSLIPHASTTCQFLPQPNSSETIEPCLSAKEHACIQCSGQFSLGVQLAGAAALEFGTVHLQPGQWGRLPGLPVRLDAAQRLRQMGIGLFRQLLVPIHSVIFYSPHYQTMILLSNSTRFSIHRIT